MTQNLDLNNDPNNESPFGLVYAEDSAFGPPIRLEPHEVSSVEVPPYEKRAEILLGDAHAILLAYEQIATGTSLDRVRRWLDRYELHLCQIDHPDPHSTGATIDGEVKDDAHDRG